jgi:hypothetical protein
MNFMNFFFHEPKLMTTGIRCADHATPSIRKSWHYFSNMRRSLLGRSVSIVHLRTKGRRVFMVRKSIASLEHLNNASPLIPNQSFSFHPLIQECVDLVLYCLVTIYSVPFFFQCLLVWKLLIFCLDVFCLFWWGCPSTSVFQLSLLQLHLICLQLT